MLYTIIPKKNTSCELIVSESSPIFNNFISGDVIQLNAGYLSENVKISFSKSQKNDILKISNDTLKRLSLPSDIPYQIVYSKEGIKIGPIIGLLMFKNKNDLNEKSLEHFLTYTLLYNNIGGLLYVFSTEALDFQDYKVEGYKYNNRDNKWEKGVFPFPNSIYRRTTIHYPLIKELKKYTNNKMFNSHFFNKLDYWNIASNSSLINDYLPFTKELTSFSDIEEMLEKFSMVYLKRKNGTRASGLVKITKDKDAYSFFSKSSNYPLLFYSKEKASKYIDNIMKNHGYIIQQGIDLLKFDDRFIDFRVIMQKDQTQTWQFTGIITSLGKQGGMCSNYADGAKYLSFEEFCEKYLMLKKYEIFQKKYEIISACKKACMALDEIGENYGDLGVDVGLDKELRPWIFELNNRRHLHSMALFIDDYDTFYMAKANPIKYATALSGFNVL